MPTEPEDINNQFEQQIQDCQIILEKIRQYANRAAISSQNIQLEAINELSLLLKEMLLARERLENVSDRDLADKTIRQNNEALEKFGTNLKHIHRLNTTDYQNLNDLFIDYLETGCEILGMETGIVGHLVDQSCSIISVKSDSKSLIPGLRFPSKDTYCSQVIKEKKTITYLHVGGMAEMLSLAVYQNLKLESYIGSPIFVNGEVYGTLSFSSTKIKSNNFFDWEREIVELMAQSIGRYIVAAQVEKERQQVEEELRRQSLRSDLFAELAFKIRQSLQLEEILQTAVTEVQKFLQADRVLLFQFTSNERGGKVVQESVVPGWPTILGQNISAPCFEEKYLELYRNGRVGAIADLENDRVQPCYLEFLQQLGVRANLVVPILQKEELWGLLIAHQCASPRQWSDFEVELLRQLADQIGIALSQGQLVEALRESEERFRTMANSAPVLIWMSASSKDYTFFNQNWLNFTGRTLQEEMGNGWMDGVHPQDFHYCVDTYTKAFDAREAFQMEYRLRRADGNYRWIMGTGVPRFTPEGEFSGFIGTAIDITQRKQAAEELQRQNQRSRLLAQVTHKIRQSLQLQEILSTAVTEVKKLLQVDRVLIVQLLNNSGVVVEEAECTDCPTMLGREIANFLLRADYLQEYRQGRIMAISDLQIAIGTFSDTEIREELGVKASLVAPIFAQKQLWGLLVLHQCHSHRRWEEFDIELSKQLADQIGIALSQAQLLEHLEDIVAQRTVALTNANKQLQQEINDRHSAQEALRRSEEQLRLITDALPVLIAYVDSEQRYRFNNRTYQQWWRKSIGQINGSHLQEVLGQDFYQEIREYVEAALSGEKVTFEKEVPYFDGSTRWVSSTYIPDFDEQGQVKGFFALANDFTERKSIELMKDQFVSIVSHELRTPLTSIHGSLKLLATGKLGELSEEGQQMLAIADENTDRLVRLVNDVLDFQRMQSGKVKIEKKACNAGELLLQATEAMQPIAALSEITLLTTPVSISVFADPDYIVQVAINLLSNAIKFSSPGNCVWMTAEARNNEVLFQVKDEGQGIPPEKLEIIFGCFQQVDASDSRSKGGTGLGLAICRQIIELHGGKIWVESTLGIGSTFYFTLKHDS